MKIKKSISLVLVLCMLCSALLTGIMVFAEGNLNNQINQNTGICVHHLAHSQECGYQEEVSEQSCNHEHDETCGYVESAEESVCNHEHDETCGYVDASQGSPCYYAVNGCPYCITKWQWVDEAEALIEVDGTWRLELPGVSQENLLTPAVAIELLPKQISATTDTGEVENQKLVWDVTSIPESGVSDGEYVVTAQLADDNYALTETADKLEVTIQSGEVETLANLPSGSPLYPENIINGVSPNGTTINLFDYWIQGQTVADNNNGDNWLNKGINSNHALLFGTGMNKESPSLGDWNGWTGTKNPRTGIVNDELIEGYPRLNVNPASAGNSEIKSRSGQESLAYLFNPNVSHDGKQSFTDVQGLLQVDRNGYYYYDSQENYAVYYQETNSFTLYDTWGVQAGGSSPNGQFFPFNKANKKNNNMNNVKSNDSSINHYFGMTMSTRFIQQNKGYTDSTKKTPVTYEFAGDDDVWIFIDGKLVADLGGIHDRASVKIDFSTGEIYINNAKQNQTLGKILGLQSDTLVDNTYHTLNFFYLERGNVDSNMSLRYNLVTIPESSIIKVDQIGDVVPGATFSLYDAKNQSVKIATGTTDANGEFVFLDEEGFPLQISNLYELYGDRGQETNTETDLILREEGVPAGYRVAGDIELYFYKAPKSEEVLLLSNSIWDKGAYAMTNVTATMPNTITLTDRNNTEIKTVNLTSQIDDNPLMFAVVFQKQDNGDWYPVYGDPIKGWTVAENANWDSVLTAARANTHQFHLASSGAYQAEVDELPGDVKTYYHICKEQNTAKYTIAYYYSEAKSLDQATETNTYLVDSEGASGDKAQPIDRVFSMNLYVTNIKNQLQVQKVDEIGTPVNGAKFALYRASDVTVANDGTVTVNGNATPYDTVVTGKMEVPFKMDGGGIFPNFDGTATSSQHEILENGDYYLVETSAPKGYKLNDTATHIIIDNTGVYADAGNEDDGLTVLRGVGSIVKSMVQFAANDKIDSTLYGIKAAKVDVKHSDSGFTWDDANWDNEAMVKHLQYKNEHGLLEYGLVTQETEATIDDLTFSWDTGWSMLRIKQCLEHYNESVDNYTNLNDLDITNLFSGTVIVRLQNQRVGNLRIEKEVATSNVSAPENDFFTFKVTAKLGENAINLNDYISTVSKSNAANITVDNNGIATVTLHDNEYLTFMGLPYGTTYEVEETAVPNGYTTTATVSNPNNTSAIINGVKVTGTIGQNDITNADDAETVHYTNTFDGSTKVSLSGQKTLLYGNISAEQFQFSLEKGSFVPDGGCSFTDSEVVSNDAAGSFQFPEITFTQAGTYRFYIKEVLPEGESGANPIIDGIQYDTHIATAEVKVTTNADGTLQATVNYSNEGASGSDASVKDKAAFTNYKVASLTISKTVSGTMGDKDKDFKFDITFKDPQGNPLVGDYRYTGGSVADITEADVKADGTITLNTVGKGTFTLKHGQSITILALPAGCSYEVSEPDADKDGYKTTITTNEETTTAYKTAGSLNNDSTSVVFKNDRDNIPNTGIILGNIPWIMATITVVGFTAMIFTKIRGQRKKDER